MDLKEWSQKYRVKMTRGSKGTENLVLGKFGEIADVYSDGQLRLRLLAVPRNAEKNKALGIRKREAMAGGLNPVHVGEHVYESIWSFDPLNDAHSKLAIDLVAPKRRRRRVMTEEAKAAAMTRLAAARAAKTAQKVL